MNSPASPGQTPTPSVNEVSREAEREAFEAWAHDHLGQGYKLDRDEEDGVYIYPVPRWAFRAWKARAAIAVQPPAASQPTDGLERAFRQLDERAREHAESHDREENEYAMGITDALTIIRAALAAVQGKKC